MVGERWTLLIVRDAFLGLRRFDGFQESLWIARNVLTDRLNRLVDEGILEPVRYSERPERFEYRLTAKGRELDIALAGLRQVIAALVPKGAPVLHPGRGARLGPLCRAPPGTQGTGYEPMRRPPCGSHTSSSHREEGERS